MRVTIKDIAKATGVSVATVSLVLNDRPHQISESTKELIRKTAQEMNYIPNPIARSLLKYKNKSIVFLTHDITNLFFTELSKHIQNEGYRLGYDVVVCHDNNDEAIREAYVKMVCQHRAGGIISCITTEAMQKKIVDITTQMDMKVVFVDGINDYSNIDNVEVHHQYGSYLATKHLLERGHTKIGCITGPKNYKSTIERLNGYRKALQEKGIHLEDAYIFEGNYQLESGSVGLRTLSQKKVTAIYAFNDMMAYGVYREAVGLGLQIPTDLSVIGFDNNLFSDVLSTPLTTVAQPIKEMAEQAVRRLVEKIESEQLLNPKNYLFQPQLIERTSVATKKEDA